MTTLTEYLPDRLSANPLQAMESDSDIEAIADAMIHASALRDECDGDTLFKASTRQLLYACLGYLRDWCAPAQRTIGNLKALLDAAAPGGAGTRRHRPRRPVLRDRVRLQARTQPGRHHHELGAVGA